MGSSGEQEFEDVVNYIPSNKNRADLFTKTLESISNNSPILTLPQTSHRSRNLRILTNTRLERCAFISFRSCQVHCQWLYDPRLQFERVMG